MVLEFVLGLFLIYGVGWIYKGYYFIGFAFLLLSILWLMFTVSTWGVTWLAVLFFIPVSCFLLWLRSFFS